MTAKVLPFALRGEYVPRDHAEVYVCRVLRKDHVPVTAEAVLPLVEAGRVMLGENDARRAREAAAAKDHPAGGAR